MGRVSGDYKCLKVVRKKNSEGSAPRSCKGFYYFPPRDPVDIEGRKEGNQLAATMQGTRQAFRERKEEEERGTLFNPFPHQGGGFWERVRRVSLLTRPSGTKRGLPDEEGPFSTPSKKKKKTHQGTVKKEALFLQSTVGLSPGWKGKKKFRRSPLQSIEKRKIPKKISRFLPYRKRRRRERVGVW